MGTFNFKTKQRIYLEIEVEVSGEYSSGYSGSYETPSMPDTFEIQTVMWNGVDITKPLDKDKFDWLQMEEDILEELTRNNTNY
jgi:hypothetical protein